MTKQTEIHITARAEKWPITGAFTISRGSKTEAIVVVAEIAQGAFIGRGECVPYARYGETPEKVLSTIASWRGGTREELQNLPAGAARNALDCAFWDLESQRSGQRAFTLAGLEEPQPVPSSTTISLAAPEVMAEAASRASAMKILKIKLGKEGDAARVDAVRRAVPQARLIVDANEGWAEANLADNLAACVANGIELIEQPLPAANDEALARIAHSIPIYADESVFDRSSLAALEGKYQGVNIKLDKAGGLTEALATAAKARQMGFDLMVGCMVSTSLALAPAFLVARHATVADLDGPLLLAKDREGGMRCENGLFYPPSLWG